MATEATRSAPRAPRSHLAQPRGYGGHEISTSRAEIASRAATWLRRPRDQHLARRDRISRSRPSASEERARIFWRRLVSGGADATASRMASRDTHGRGATSLGRGRVSQECQCALPRNKGHPALPLARLTHVVALQPGCVDGILVNRTVYIFGIQLSQWSKLYKRITTLQYVGA